MKQKLGLVAALQHDPPLAILDEPTGGLDPVDPGAPARVARRRARAAGRTIFFSSHVLAEVEELCDRVAMIRDGRLLLVGPARRAARARAAAASRCASAEPVDPARYAVAGVGAVGGGRGPAPLHARRATRAPLLAALAALPVADVAIERAEPGGRLPRPLRDPRAPREDDLRLALERARVRIRARARLRPVRVRGRALVRVGRPERDPQLVDALPPALRALAGERRHRHPDRLRRLRRTCTRWRSPSRPPSRSRWRAAPARETEDGHRRAGALAPAAAARAGSPPTPWRWRPGSRSSSLGGYLGGLVAAARGGRPRPGRPRPARAGPPRPATSASSPSAA